MNHEQNQKIWNLIKHMRAGMLVTSGGRFVHARPMALLQKEFDGSLWFFTSKESAKLDEVVTNPEVCVTFADPHHKNYVSITGNATLSMNRGKIDELWCWEAQAFFAGGKIDPDLIVLRVDVSHAEYWDVNACRMAQLFEFAKGRLTGHYPEMSENQKFN
jgi:general stress protein 26